MAKDNIIAEFRALDTAHSGYLSREEINQGLIARSLPHSAKELDEFFRHADKDHDGKISLSEFERFCAKRESAIRTIYAQMDANGDAKLSSEEVRLGVTKLGFKLSSEQLRSFMNRADNDNSGSISFEEFQSFLLLLPKVNPAAVYEGIRGEALVDHANSEYTPPQDRGDKESMLTVLATKLYAGSIAGALSRTMTAPVDRLKMMMQTTPPGQSNGGMMQVLRNIYQEGGVRAFFRGNGVNVLKIAPETSSKFVAFDFYKQLIAKDPSNVTVAERFIAGGAAGATAQTLIYPLEICKTRLAVSAPGTYSGIPGVIRAIVQQQGFAALYNGLNLSVIAVVPYAGIDLAVNSLLKDRVAAWYAQQQSEPGVASVLACGMASSTCAMLATYPMKTLQTRLQMSGMPGRPTFSGPIDCFRQTIAAGGAKALYQGLVPNMIKVLPSTAISYAAYDMLSK